MSGRAASPCPTHVPAYRPLNPGAPPKAPFTFITSSLSSAGGAPPSPPSLERSPLSLQAARASPVHPDGSVTPTVRPQRGNGSCQDLGSPSLGTPARNHLPGLGRRSREHKWNAGRRRMTCPPLAHTHRKASVDSPSLTRKRLGQDWWWSGGTVRVVRTALVPDGEKEKKTFRHSITRSSTTPTGKIRPSVEDKSSSRRA